MYIVYTYSSKSDGCNKQAHLYISCNTFQSCRIVLKRVWPLVLCMLGEENSCEACKSQNWLLFRAEFGQSLVKVWSNCSALSYLTFRFPNLAWSVHPCLDELISVHWWWWCKSNVNLRKTNKNFRFTRKLGSQKSKSRWWNIVAQRVQEST